MNIFSQEIEAEKAARQEEELKTLEAAQAEALGQAEPTEPADPDLYPPREPEPILGEGAPVKKPRPPLPPLPVSQYKPPVEIPVEQPGQGVNAKVIINEYIKKIVLNKILLGKM